MITKIGVILLSFLGVFQAQATEFICLEAHEHSIIKVQLGVKCANSATVLEEFELQGNKGHTFSFTAKTTKEIEAALAQRPPYSSVNVAIRWMWLPSEEETPLMNAMIHSITTVEDFKLFNTSRIPLYLYFEEQPLAVSLKQEPHS